MKLLLNIKETSLNKNLQRCENIQLYIKNKNQSMNEGQTSPKLSMSKSDEASPISYARVVILGDGGVGKNALIKVICVCSGI